MKVAKSNEAHDQSAESSDLLQEMLSSADAEQAKGSQYTVRELLDEFSASLGDQLADQPAVEADIHATIGRAYRSLRLPNQAQPHFEKAIELRRQVDGPQAREVGRDARRLWVEFREPAAICEAETQLRKALGDLSCRGSHRRSRIHALRILELVMYSSDQRSPPSRFINKPWQLPAAVMRIAGASQPSNCVRRRAQ